MRQVAAFAASLLCVPYACAQWASGPALTERGAVHFVHDGTAESAAHAHRMRADVQEFLHTAAQVGVPQDCSAGDVGSAAQVVCPTLGDLQPHELRFVAMSLAELDWGEYGIEDDLGDPPGVVRQLRDAVAQEGRGVLAVRRKVSSDHLQCILPEGLPATYAHCATPLDIHDTAHAVGSWVASCLHMEVDPVFRLHHAALMAGLYWPGERDGGVPLECDTVDAKGLTEQRFREEYVERSKPVVIKGGAADLGCSQWSLDYISSRIGSRGVHVKIAPGGLFEGPEDVAQWQDAEQDALPPHVLSRLESPHRVIVRPAAATLTVDEVLQRLQGAEGNASFYLEYSSLAALKEVGDDVTVPAWARFLDLSAKNIWLGGDTLGKLHFDPFDNLMAVAEGEKVFTLMHPYRNEWAYEGHIREATLSYNHTDGTFGRAVLPDATAMVMSPVHINDEAELERYSQFAQLNSSRLTCRVGAGDALFVPSHWWHEVDSRGPHTLAANMWFHPLYKKAHPCATCRLHLDRRRYYDRAL